MMVNSASLKHYKDDVKEVTNGREGGLMIDGYNDIKMDDVIEAYVMEEINDFCPFLGGEGASKPMVSLLIFEPGRQNPCDGTSVPSLSPRRQMISN